MLTRLFVLVPALASAFVVFVPQGAAAAPKQAAPAVKLVRNEADRRVDVLVDGKPFTSYIWPERVKKPALFPIHAASGVAVTRGYPLDPKPGDKPDHPHHVGLWFNYGEVNHGSLAGIDFWGHSEATKPEALAKAGTIEHRSIKSARGGAGRGELAVTSDWVLPDKKTTALKEETRFVFVASEGRRAIDRIATLTAPGADVAFPDNKEGALGLRVGRALDHPNPKDDKPGAEGPKPTGRYLTSEGKQGDDAWGTRARWTLLTGTVEGGPITVAILDHPSNPGHPTYWHARGYGLFAANPFAQAVMSKGKERLDFKLGKGKKARFAYRVVVLDRQATADEIEAEWKRFVSEVK